MSASTNGNTVRLTTAQAIVKFLQVQYSERDGEERRLIAAIFGIFGHGNVSGIGQALREYGAELPYYQPCNEQAMVHTAAGFAKANQRLATLACTSSIGPGATNMITGAAGATINRLPVLLLPSDYYATRHQGPVLQGLEHPLEADVSVNDCFRPVSRFFDRIIRPEQILTALPAAMRVLTDPADTGAVTISLPQDVQTEAYDFPESFFEPRRWRVERRAPSAERIAEAVDMINTATRPVIIAGGGVHYSAALAELRQLAEKYGIPVAETFAGKGALPSDSPMSLGGVGMSGTGAAAAAIGQADLIIAVGTRLTDTTTGSQSVFGCSGVRFVGVNTTAADAGKQGALPVVADAREALRALDTALGSSGTTADAAYGRQIATQRQTWAEDVSCGFEQVDGEAMSQGQLIRVLNEEAQAGDTVVAAAGGPPGDLLKVWETSGERACHLEFGYSCMGYEIPAAIGVRMARPEGEIFVYIGDGTYLMNPTELVTAIQENLKITVVISENHGFQCIWNLQMARAGREFGNEFRARDAATKRLEGDYLAIDFAANAASFGVRTWRVTEPQALRDALREARGEERACVIVVETEKHRFLPDAGVWWDIATAEVSDDAITARLRAQYEEGRVRQRFHH